MGSLQIDDTPLLNIQISATSIEANTTAVQELAFIYPFIGTVGVSGVGSVSATPRANKLLSYAHPTKWELWGVSILYDGDSVIGDYYVSVANEATTFTGSYANSSNKVAFHTFNKSSSAVRSDAYMKTGSPIITIATGTCLRAWIQYGSASGGNNSETAVVFWGRQVR